MIAVQESLARDALLPCLLFPGSMAPSGKCLIFREAAIAGLTELSLAGSPSGCDCRVRLV
jgi:hypothetical protein